MIRVTQLLCNTSFQCEGGSFIKGNQYRCIVFDDKAVTHTEEDIKYELPITSTLDTVSIDSERFEEIGE